jgi:nucleoside-diphosphate kinase
MSSLERTLSIIKPDAVSQGQAGEILSMLERAGFRICAMRMLRLSREQAEGFYAVHREKGFFGSLVEFMTEGPVIVMALEREDAIRKLREVMGATDPANAAEGTIRRRFAQSIERNAIHGSDSPETAAFELAYFFSSLDLV